MFMLIYALCYLPGHIVLGIIIPRSRRWRCPAAHVCSSSCFCTRAIFRRRTPLKSRISYAPWKILRPRCPYGLDNQRGADPREIPAALSAILSDNYIISRDKKFSPNTPTCISCKCNPRLKSCIYIVDLFETWRRRRKRAIAHATVVSKSIMITAAIKGTSFPRNIHIATVCEVERRVIVTVPLTALSWWFPARFFATPGRYEKARCPPISHPSLAHLLSLLLSFFFLLFLSPRGKA